DPDDEASPRFFRAYGRDVNEPERELIYNRETRRLSLWGGSRKDSMLGEVLKAVCDILADCPDLSGYAIEQRACMDGGHTRQNVRDALKKGIRDGLIATKP